jgi:hypothetical protein
MKIKIILILIIGYLIIPINVIAQQKTKDGEFDYYRNGYIYNPATISQLKVIVDSLNIKHEKCNYSIKRYSYRQGTGNFVQMEVENVEKLQIDLNNAISFDSFINKYPKAVWNEDLFIISRPRLIEYRNIGKTVFFESIETESINRPSVSIPFGNEISLKTGGWVYRIFETTLYAFYLTSDHIQIDVPEKYSRLINYADCLIDTNTTLFKKGARRVGGIFFDDDTTIFPNINNYQSYVKSLMYYPKPKLQSYKKYVEGQAKRYEKTRNKILDRAFKHDKVFKSLLAKAYEEAITKFESTDELEKDIERYFGKAAALEIFRSRIVVGTCSDDWAPREQALKIAKYAAETMNWEIFLRAHLDILTDKFQRNTDGNYAWGERKTYLGELEELGINTLDLMIGISLVMDNPSNNHYYGNSHRVGRALTEIIDKSAAEKFLTESIKDEKLDGFNRLNLYYVFRNYVSHLNEDPHKMEMIKEVNNLSNYLPPSLSKRISEMK